MRDDEILMTRKDAIHDIRIGRGIQKTHVGRFSTFRVIIRRKLSTSGVKVEAAIDCPVMRRTYYVTLTLAQVMAYIRLHYPRHVWEDVDTNLNVFPTNYQEHREEVA